LKQKVLTYPIDRLRALHAFSLNRPFLPFRMKEDDLMLATAYIT
jgi:hypothetical protein